MLMIAEVGIVHNVHRRHHGVKGDPLVLVVQSDSRSLNPALNKERIAREYDRDPESAEAEWGGRFRMPTTQYLARDIVERAVTRGVSQRPPVVALRGRYLAFCDVAGGATERGDSFAWAIGHEQRQQGEVRYVVDAVGEIRPRFSSEVAVRTCAEQLLVYGIRKVVGDASAKGWPMQAFARAPVRGVSRVAEMMKQITPAVLERAAQRSVRGAMWPRRPMLGY
jgi:hypothetical protein